MTKVREEKVTNGKVRQMFDNIQKVSDMIRTRKLTLLGTVMRNKQFHCSIIAAWLKLKRPRGKPRYTLCSTVVSFLKEMIPDVDDKGSLDKWTKYVWDKTQ